MMWIIEPHSDDAYLSLHEHLTILWKDKPKTIVTVFCNEKRRQEAEKYATIAGCDHRGLMYEEGGGLSHQEGYCGTWDDWNLPVKPSDIVVFPIGLQHPDHYSVVYQLANCKSSKVVWRYLDTPYYAKQKLADELQDRTVGKQIISVRYCSTRKWKHIPIFASQGKYFFHHPPESMPRLELVVR